jgi:hypothetical protein
MSTRWDDIMDTLHSSNIDAYSPATKEGECTAPYVVVKMSGSSNYKGYSTDVCYYDVMCYVPKNSYGLLPGYVTQVKEAMKKLQPMIKPAGQETPSYYDDTYKAHMTSVMYSNYVKL